ncbi:Rha family phage regulatory protein [Comamonas sp. BIGb0124]|uniref:Rha family transcriptional regulator n=1 Tax=Comamonas sp. BIGb0124 TaxID=2485130 RepID=UPI000FAB44E9|nr:Rha family transcriptional regulator [Comamonas sp. BIGb0124]ROR21722.1 Rha family phage regulatory protein [Comamonas sp. BIGb0124]
MMMALQITDIAVDPLTMSSREIAELTGKRHDNVIADIRKMLVELHSEGGLLNFQDTHANGQNGQSYPIFRLPKRETLILVSGYSVVLRARIIDRWQELERMVDQPRVPQTLPEALRLAADMAERAAQAEQQRDVAIATKAEIGSRREATAMATASTAVRQASRLKDRLGFSARHATILAVEKASGQRFGAQGWRPLKKWCDAHAIDAESVPDARYGEVRAWPADAWGEVYGIDLDELFADESRGA